MVASTVLVISFPKCLMWCFMPHKVWFKAQGHDPSYSSWMCIEIFFYFFKNPNSKSKQAVVTYVVMTVYVFIFETRFL